MRWTRRVGVQLPIAVIVALAGAIAVAVPATVTNSDQAEHALAQPAPTPAQTPLSKAQQVLAAHPDVPGACAVSFVVDGADVAPQLQVSNQLYAALPIPRVTGRVFAGWYATASQAADATAHPATAAVSPAVRVNGSRLVTCGQDSQQTLYGAWTTEAQVKEAAAKVSILMYHQFTQKPEGESGWLRGNYSYVEDYRATMKLIKSEAFYLPTWDELSAFIDGQLYLPQHSVIVTDDDADPTWLALASPMNEQEQVMATSFDITGDGVAQQNRFILRRSHTHAMHVAGANGKGQMVNLSPSEIAADMTASAAALTAAGVTSGSHEIMAYPYGHYDDRSKEGLRQAGFEMARTVEPGTVQVGSDKLALPCVRVNYGMTAADVAALIR